MPRIFLQSQVPYPIPIQVLRLLVFWWTLLYAGWFGLAESGVISSFPDPLLLSPHLELSWLFQLISSSLTIAFPGFSISMVFDLFLLNFFLTPIYSFVFSFLTTRHFFKLLVSLIIIGAFSFSICASFFIHTTPPTSLFSGMSFAIVIFWALLHRRGQSTLLLAFPISRAWALSLSALVTFYPPLSNGEWARVGAIVIMAVAAYLWGITRWRLRSNIDSLEGWEQWLDTKYRTLSRFMQWYVFGFIRKWFHKT